MLDGRAADDHTRHTGREPIARVVDGADAPTRLHPGPHVRADRLDHREVRIPAVACRVEVDHVDPACAGRVEPARDRDRVVVVDGLVLVVAPGEAHDLSGTKVDRGIEVHQPSAGLATASTKLRSMRIPTSPDFSGWNCVAQSAPISTAAANRRP